MGLEVSRIFALAEGSFHIRNTKKATLGTSSKMSQNRTLKQRHRREGHLLVVYFHFTLLAPSQSKASVIPGVSNVLVQDLQTFVRLGDVGSTVRLPGWEC